MGSDGWVRSRAWTWVFSSKLNTTARSGGSRYNPTTSVSLASKSASLDNLNTSARQGRRPLARQIRATVSLPTPWRAANDRVDQHTDPSSGTAATVSPTIAATVAAAIWGLRPPTWRHLANTGRPRLQEPVPPTPHRVLVRTQLPRHRPHRLPAGQRQQRTRRPHPPIRLNSRPSQPLQRRPILHRQLQHLNHAPTLAAPTIKATDH